MSEKEIRLEDIPGIGPKTAEKLREVGFTDPMAIAVISPSELAAIAEIGEGQAAKIIAAVREILDIGLVTADKILERKQKALRITTGSKALDNLLGGGVESLPPDEKVLVINKGELKQVKIGELVDEALTLGSVKKGISEIGYANPRNAYSLSFDENFKVRPIKITAFVRHKLIGNIYRISLSRGRRLKVTGDHSIFVFRDGKILPVPVREITYGDFLVVPKKINVEADKEELNLLSLVFDLEDKLLKKLYVKDKKFNEFIFSFFKPEIIKLTKKLGYKKRKYWDWKYENRLPLDVLKHLNIDEKIFKKYKPRFGSKELINSIVKVDKDFCWLLGFILAEGGAIQDYPYLGINQEKSRLYVLKKAQRLFKKIFGLRVPIYPQKRHNSFQYVLTTSNRAIWTVFKALGITNYSYKKTIPSFIFGLKPEKIKSFLKGYFEGDKEVKRGTVGWCTSSESLANDLCLLLLRLGEIPVLNYHKDRRKRSYKGIYYVFVFKLKNINKLGEEIEERYEYDIFPCRDVILKLLRKYNLTGELNRFYNLAFQGQPTVKTVKAFIKEFKQRVGRSEEVEMLEKILNSEVRFEKVVNIELLKERPTYVYDLQVLNNPTLDNFLAGLYVFAHNTQAITETYGAFGSGKCVSKDTPVIFFNDGNFHYESIEDAYEKYKKIYGEIKFDEGYIVPLKNVKVIGFTGFEFKKVEAAAIYKEFVKNICILETKRGKLLKATKAHRLLTFDGKSLSWKPIGLLKKGDWIASPKSIEVEKSSISKTQLSLLSKRWESTIANKKVKKRQYWIFLSRKCSYPKPFVNYLRKIYHLTIDECEIRKKVRRRFLIRACHIFRKGRVQSINQKTINEVVSVFNFGRNILLKARKLAENLENLKNDELRELIDVLPFPYKTLSVLLVVNKSTLQNYIIRGLPKRNKKRIKLIKMLIIREIDKRLKLLEECLRTCELISKFAWDEIKRIEEVRYNDYVYDFVVPDGHTFVGGFAPLLLHNTQLAHQLSVNVQLPPEKGGLGKTAVYIDCEGTFSPNRIVSMAKAKGLDPQAALKNVFVARAFNAEHQMFIVDKLREQIEEKNIGLIVIDSITSHFRAEYVGRGELAERQQKLNKHLHALQRLADAFNLAVYITNQVMADPSVIFGDPTRPVGGHVLGHFSTYRIYLRRSKENIRIAKLIDAPNLPESEATFKITEEGIKDVDEK